MNNTQQRYHKPYDKDVGFKRGLTVDFGDRKFIRCSSEACIPLPLMFAAYSADTSIVAILR